MSTHLNTPGNAMLLKLEGPSPAIEVARDLVRRGAYVVPVAAFIGAAFWGTGGAVSVIYACAIVLVNFLLSGLLLGWGGRVSFAVMGAAAMFGFFLRLGLMFLAVFLVKDAGWFEAVPLGITLVVTHLGLLLWELRFVSASMAYPGLKPRRAATRSTERAA